MRPVRVGVLCAAACAAASVAEAGAPDGAASRTSLLYIPPWLESSVILYHSFASGVMSPEVNAIGASVEFPKEVVPDGLTGPGLAIHDRGAADKEFHFRSDELSPHRNLTLSMWWRVDEPLADASCYHLLALRGKGYVSSFVRVKHSLTGRSFRADDGVAVAGFGPTWLFHPMTIDDVMVCNRALNEDEVRNYVEAVRHLREVGFPFSDGRDVARAGSMEPARNMR